MGGYFLSLSRLAEILFGGDYYYCTCFHNPTNIFSHPEPCGKQEKRFSLLTAVPGTFSLPVIQCVSSVFSTQARSWKLKV